MRAALARALLKKKLFHFDINDGYRLKHDVDIAEPRIVRAGHGVAGIVEYAYAGRILE